MDFFTIFFYLSIAGGLLMAFSLGANDVANSMAPAVGAKAISIRTAVLIAAFLNFAGAAFLGAKVASTISKGIVNPEYITDPKILAIGMAAALLTAGTWVLISTLTGAPVSSTHSIVGGLLGFGLVAAGTEAVDWSVVGFIAASWIISPLMAGAIGAIIYIMIKKSVLESKNLLAAARFWAPFWIFLTALLVMGSFIFKTPFGKDFKDDHYEIAMATLVVVPVLFGLLGWHLIRKAFPGDGGTADDAEEIYKKLQISTACYVALSQGANDVANAMGPVIALYLLAKYHMMPRNPDVPMWILGLGGVFIGIGVFALGYKVIATVGEKITKLSNTKGFAVSFSGATTILAASVMGVPVSSTTVAVGAVAGVGATEGLDKVNFKVLARVFAFWVLTVPIAAVTSILFFYLLKTLFY